MTAQEISAGPQLSGPFRRIPGATLVPCGPDPSGIIVQRVAALCGVVILLASCSGEVEGHEDTVGPNPTIQATEQATEPLGPTRIAGTAVTLSPPSGFVVSSEWRGFVHPAAQATILAFDVPENFVKSTWSLRSSNPLIREGLTALYRDEHEVDGKRSLLVGTRLSIDKREYRKWILAVDRGGSTAVIVAALPKEAGGELEDPLRESLLKARVLRDPDPRVITSKQRRLMGRFRLHRMVGASATVLAEARRLAVPGTALSMRPPSGFVAAKRWSGFKCEAKSSSIMVTEMPASYEELIQNGNEEKFAAKGLKIRDRWRVSIDGRRARLMEASQRVGRLRVGKYLAIVEGGDVSWLLTASFPMARYESDAAPLMASLLSASFGASSDPLEALPFEITPVEPFDVALVMGTTLSLSPGGQFPQKGDDTPFMTVSTSLSESWKAPSSAVWVETLLEASNVASALTMRHTRPVSIDGKQGFVTMATGKSRKESIPWTLYQVVLFDKHGYLRILGTTPTSRESEVLPLFEAMSLSLRVRE